MRDAAFVSKRFRNLIRQLQHCVRSIRANVKHLVPGGGIFWRLRDDRSDIIDVRKRARLQTIPKDCHGLPLQRLVHKNTDHVSIFVSDVLALAVNIMGTEHDVIESEHFVSGPEINSTAYFDIP